MSAHKWVYLASLSGSDEFAPELFRCCDCGAVERFRPWADDKYWIAVDDLDARADCKRD